MMVVSVLGFVGNVGCMSSTVVSTFILVLCVLPIFNLEFFGLIISLTIFPKKFPSKKKIVPKEKFPLTLDGEFFLDQ